MLHALAFAAATATSPTILRSANAVTAPRFVRLRLDVTAYGVAGRGEIVVDRATGRFVRRFDAGPVSEREGWDGVRPWRADATGMARPQGNADERASIAEWSRLLAPGDGSAAHEHPVQAPEVTVNAAGEVTSVVQHVGHQTERIAFTDYRRADGIVAPFAIEDSSENGTWSARVRSVETPASVAATAFALPPEPQDATLSGVEKIAFLRGDLPVIPVSIDGGPTLRMVLDTGGQNAITPEAARRSGLALVGEGSVGGAGAGLAKVRFAAARSVRIGHAEMRDQPFVVIDLGANAAVDGIVGYELLARFAARIDLQRGRLELSRSARALKPTGVPVPMTFDDRQPQVEGALDGIAGVMTIDTGSASSVDVNAPFVLAHDLRTLYHAEMGGFPISGIGGAVHAYYARAKELRLGTLQIPDVNLLLTDAKAGFEANPAVAANIGGQVLRRFVLLVDYRNATIWFG